VADVRTDAVADAVVERQLHSYGGYNNTYSVVIMVIRRQCVIFTLKNEHC
jgi:hypothetical protein